MAINRRGRDTSKKSKLKISNRNTKSYTDNSGKKHTWTGRTPHHISRMIAKERPGRIKSADLARVGETRKTRKGAAGSTQFYLGGGKWGTKEQVQPLLDERRDAAAAKSASKAQKEKESELIFDGSRYRPRTKAELEEIRHSNSLDLALQYSKPDKDPYYRSPGEKQKPDVTSYEYMRDNSAKNIQTQELPNKGQLTIGSESATGGPKTFEEVFGKKPTSIQKKLLIAGFSPDELWAKKQKHDDWKKHRSAGTLDKWEAKHYPYGR